jgi:hypothetical protein
VAAADEGPSRSNTQRPTRPPLARVKPYVIFLLFIAPALFAAGFVGALLNFSDGDNWLWALVCLVLAVILGVAALQYLRRPVDKDYRDSWHDQHLDS